MKKRYQIVAQAFDKRGILLAVAGNSYTKTHPLQKYFAEKVGHPQKQFQHAEIACLLKCRDKQPYMLKVWRYGQDGQLLNAKPCPICQEALRAFGVNQVWYSDEQNNMVKL